MFGLLGIAAIVGTCCFAVKDACAPTIPAENWANYDLYYKDMMNGIPIEQRMKNVKNGKYRLTEDYPEPHRNKNGKIIIENSQLYYDDVRKYGAYQAQKWVRQGKYNLNPEELKKECERINKNYEYLYGN